MSQRREREKDTFRCEGYPAVSAAIHISALPGSTQAAQLYSQTEQLLDGEWGWIFSHRFGGDVFIYSDAGEGDRWGLREIIHPCDMIPIKLTRRQNIW